MRGSWTVWHKLNIMKQSLLQYKIRLPICIWLYTLERKTSDKSEPCFSIYNFYTCIASKNGNWTPIKMCKKNCKKHSWKLCDAAQRSHFYFQCETLFYKNVDGNFKKSPIGIAAAPCCEVMFENELFKRIMENQTVPKACPFTPVSSHIH